MSYTLIVAEVRRGQFEERNFDCIGLSNLLGKESVMVLPNGDCTVNDRLVDTCIRTNLDETVFLNPLIMINTIQKIIESRGKPDTILFTSSSSGNENAAYAAGFFNLPLISDVSRYDGERGIFYKSYYSDKVFGEFKPVAQQTLILTVRSGSFKNEAVEKASSAAAESVNIGETTDKRSFMEYVEEEKTDVDITKADFLLSVGRGIGNPDEIPAYEELASLLNAVISGSRPVIDKQWLPKFRQVGTSGKTVKPKVYFAMGISGAFQHIAGMKDSECIIAVNKDAEAPIFQYAHYGIVADIHKVRDKLKAILKQ